MNPPLERRIIVSADVRREENGSEREKEEKRGENDLPKDTVGLLKSSLVSSIHEGKCAIVILGS